MTSAVCFSACRVFALLLSVASVLVWVIVAIRSTRLRYASFAAMLYGAFLLIFLLVTLFLNAELLYLNRAVLNAWSLAVHTYSAMIVLGVGIIAILKISRRK